MDFNSNENRMNNFRERIVMRMSPMDFANKNWPRAEDWDRYFDEYSNVKFISKGDDFLAYTDGVEVFVKDFISDDTVNSIRLWKELEKISKGKTVKAKIHAVNYKLLQTAIRLGFSIESFDGTQYQVKREMV